MTDKKQIIDVIKTKIMLYRQKYDKKPAYLILHWKKKQELYDSPWIQHQTDSTYKIYGMKIALLESDEDENTVEVI